MKSNKLTLVGAAMAAYISGCATPVTMLQNESGHVARCGGGTGGATGGGYIGYSIEKTADEQCVRDFESKGYKRM